MSLRHTRLTSESSQSDSSPLCLDVGRQAADTMRCDIAEALVMAASQVNTATCESVASHVYTMHLVAPMLRDAVRSVYVIRSKVANHSETARFHGIAGCRWAAALLVAAAWLWIVAIMLRVYAGHPGAALFLVYVRCDGAVMGCVMRGSDPMPGQATSSDRERQASTSVSHPDELADASKVSNTSDTNKDADDSILVSAFKEFMQSMKTQGGSERYPFLNVIPEFDPSKRNQTVQTLISK